jgi:quercetin dioxygenase-like cupin family protein
MKDVDRRSALTLGLAATSAVVMADSAVAQPYTPDQGTELAPGVRRIDVSKRESMIPAYKSVALHDVVYQPKSKSTNPSMANDMVCHCLEGELRVNQGPGKDFTVKKGDVWSCNEGLPENNENIGSGVAIMRVIDLLPT